MPKKYLSLLCALALLLGMTACGSRSAERQSDAAQPTVEERTPADSERNRQIMPQAQIT